MLVVEPCPSEDSGITRNAEARPLRVAIMRMWWIMNRMDTAEQCVTSVSIWPRGVTVSTLDSESSDRGSNPREAFLLDIFCAKRRIAGLANVSIVSCARKQSKLNCKKWLTPEALKLNLCNVCFCQFYQQQLALMHFTCAEHIAKWVMQ